MAHRSMPKFQLRLGRLLLLLLGCGVVLAAAQAANSPPLYGSIVEVVLQRYRVEALLLLLGLLYAANIFIGRQKNHRLAAAWSDTFAAPGALLSRNFHQHGYVGCNDADLHWRDGQACFKASSSSVLQT